MLPLVLRLPVQAPEAMHAVALVVDQVSVDGSPTGTLAGAIAMLTVGCGAGGSAATTEALFATPFQLSV